MEALRSTLNELRGQGNEAFKRGDDEEALRLYTQGIKAARKAGPVDLNAETSGNSVAQVGAAARCSAVQLCACGQGVKAVGSRPECRDQQAPGGTGVRVSVVCGWVRGCCAMPVRMGRGEAWAVRLHAGASGSPVAQCAQPTPLPPSMCCSWWQRCMPTAPQLP